MTGKEFETISNLKEDVETLGRLVESIDKHHWIAINSPEIYASEGNCLYFFDDDLKKFIKEKYIEAMRKFSEITIEMKA